MITNHNISAVSFPVLVVAFIESTQICHVIATQSIETDIYYPSIVDEVYCENFKRQNF